MLALLLTSTLLAGLPAEAPEDYLEVSRMGYPWFGLTFAAAVHMPPVISFRLRAGVRTAWDIVEFGGEAIAGGSWEGHAGGSGYLKITPYPVGLGRIFYVRGSVGRLHFRTPIDPRHEGTVQALLGFQIPLRSGEIMFIEAGVDHRRVCRDWAMPCTLSEPRWWPALAFGFTMF